MFSSLCINGYYIIYSSSSLWNDVIIYVLCHAYRCRPVSDRSNKNEKIRKHMEELVDGIDTVNIDVLDVKEYNMREGGSKAVNAEKVIEH